MDMNKEGLGTPYSKTRFLKLTHNVHEEQNKLQETGMVESGMDTVNGLVMLCECKQITNSKFRCEQQVTVNCTMDNKVALSHKQEQTADTNKMEMNI